MGRYSKEFRERGVRLAQEAMDKHDSRWAAVESIAKKLGVLPADARPSGSSKPNVTRALGQA